MEIRDTVGEKETAAAPAGAGSRKPTDRFEMKPHWERSEEERVEQVEVLYEKAVRGRIQAEAPALPPQPQSEEELMAITHELKLQQMCQGIAAQVMVDELEDELDEEEEPRPKKKRREE